MKKKMNVLMVAAENDALPGGKVGGIGDVVRDVPVALADIGCHVDVVTPGYRMFSRLPGAQHVRSLDFAFAGGRHQAHLYRVPPKNPVDGVRHWAVELPDFIAPGSARIYSDDPPDAPFATDATKFACFCAAAGTVILDGDFGKLDVIHLHDWHAAFVLLLRQYAPAFGKLQSTRTVYTIHNLALQGVRPLGGHESSLHAWFPGLAYQQDVINDPRAPHCINPMRAGINLADKIHVVSPTYAEEVLLPSVPKRGYIGGEGLEDDLVAARSAGKLVGILNGCVYADRKYTKLAKSALVELLETEILAAAVKQPFVDSGLFVAQKRAESWAARKDRGFVVTSVGRITNQKVAILRHVLPSGKSALDELLLALGDEGVFILLGSGDEELERFLTLAAGRHRNFVFVKAYAEALSDALYQSGDLFLMPSSFEPCGISQMLAMRAGQPCLVHAVGGLNDTVADGVNGFSFCGNTLDEQATNLVKRFVDVMRMKKESPDEWNAIADKAAAERFLWTENVRRYISDLYN